MMKILDFLWAHFFQGLFRLSFVNLKARLGGLKAPLSLPKSRLGYITSKYYKKIVTFKTTLWLKNYMASG